MTTLAQTVHEWILRHKERIGLVLIGHTAKRIEEYLFDWLLYGLVVGWSMYTYGPVYGSFVAFVIMAPLSALVCYGYIRFYDWAKKDWLGFETIEELREQEASHGWFMRTLVRVAKRGDWAMFVALSIYGDPFMTTVYFRRGSHLYNGLSRRDWKIFWASVLFSNAYWTLRWVVIFIILVPVWERFLAPLFGFT